MILLLYFVHTAVDLKMFVLKASTFCVARWLDLPLGYFVLQDLGSSIHL